MPVVGFLHSGSPRPFASFLPPSTRAWVRRVMSRARTSRSNTAGRRIHYDRLPALAAELVRTQVAVIVASGGGVAPAGGKGGDLDHTDRLHGRARPRRSGLVVSLNRPGGNMTGTALFTAELDAKRLELLRELVPDSDLIAVLVNPNRPDAEAQSRDVQAAARALGRQVERLQRRQRATRSMRLSRLWREQRIDAL